MSAMVFRFMILLHSLVRGLGNRILPRTLTNPRKFSNVMLRKYGPLLRGSVINVSGWNDEDREGKRYQDYFTQKSSYAVSNAPTAGKGIGSLQDGSMNEIQLNLLDPLPETMRESFDVVFNHTTLEHVLDPLLAFRNLCAMSRDVVIVVVPVQQQIHHSPSYGDYWRPTTMVLAKLFLDNGFQPLVLECNDQPFAPIYCFALAVRVVEKHPDIEPSLKFNMGRYNYGTSLNEADTRRLLWPERDET